MSEEADSMSVIYGLNLTDFIEVMKLVKWVIEGEELGMELVYLDDEVIQFRRGKPNEVNQQKETGYGE